jgi:hypothetical protein
MITRDMCENRQYYRRRALIIVVRNGSRAVVEHSVHQLTNVILGLVPRTHRAAHGVES